MFGFSVTKIADAEPHYGFVLDRDHLYLTDTFLVTHNTGLGKSLVIRLLVKQVGLPTVVMAPSTSIAGQLLRDLAGAFGSGKVGQFFDGRKQLGRLVTVATMQSLQRVKRGSGEWRELEAARLMVVDEAHQVPADRLSEVCLGLLATAPYRAFFTGTHLRTDGLDLLLEGISGQPVFRMSVREGVQQGYLARPEFRFVRLPATRSFQHPDVNRMTREHVLRNPALYRACGQIVNRCVAAKMPTLVLVKEVDQFARLLPHLRHEARFAHGGLTEENRDSVPAAYRDDDTDVLVEAFNAGRVPVLVGTSCISTGTDLQPVGALHNLRGGKSEIDVRQSIGRGTRGGRLGGVQNPWTGAPKESFLYFDYDVVNGDSGFAPHRHALDRAAICDEVCGPVRWVETGW